MGSAPIPDVFRRAFPSPIRRPRRITKETVAIISEAGRDADHIPVDDIVVRLWMSHRRDDLSLDDAQRLMKRQHLRRALDILNERTNLPDGPPYYTRVTAAFSRLYGRRIPNTSREVRQCIPGLAGRAPVAGIRVIRDRDDPQVIEQFRADVNMVVKQSINAIGLLVAALPMFARRRDREWIDESIRRHAGWTEIDWRDRLIVNPVRKSEEFTLLMGRYRDVFGEVWTG
jgi:hypothetical protein